MARQPALADKREDGSAGAQPSPGRTPQNPVSPHDLPRGSAETTLPGYVEMCADRGNEIAKRVVAAKRRNGFPTLLFEMTGDTILDAGIAYYGEFFCNLEAAAKFLREGLTLNGSHGTVTVVQRYMNGAQMKFWPTDSSVNTPSVEGFAA